MHYGWPVRTAIVLIAIVYCMTGLHKLQYSGLGWAASDNLRWVLYTASDSQDGNSLGLFIADRPLLSHLFAWGTLFLECTFPLVLIWPVSRWLYVPGVVSMHAGIYATMHLNYVAMASTVIIVYVNWAWIADCVRAPQRGARAMAAGAGAHVADRVDSRPPLEFARWRRRPCSTTSTAGSAAGPWRACSPGTARRACARWRSRTTRASALLATLDPGGAAGLLARGVPRRPPVLRGTGTGARRRAAAARSRARRRCCAPCARSRAGATSSSPATARFPGGSCRRRPSARATDAIRARSAPDSLIFDERVAAGRAGPGGAAAPCAP